jgi:hypothetical protein
MRAAIYLRVSTDEQTTDNQERELRATAERAGHEVVAVYRDAGISGAKGRDKRPGFDAMHKDAARRRFDVVMAWSVEPAGSLTAGPDRVHAVAAVAQDRPIPTSAGPRYHDPCRQEVSAQEGQAGLAGSRLSPVARSM